MMNRRFAVSPDTILKFPTEIATYHSGDDVVVVSPKDGNWLVITDQQVKLIEQLMQGRSVGVVLSDSDDKNACLALLKQIVARNFTDRALVVSDRTSTAMFYLTYDCNLQCEHCYMYAQKRRGAPLTVAEYSDIFASLRGGGVDEATFSGGEPLMRKDFWEIISASHENGLTSKVFSNGTLWTDADIENARSREIKVQISIDGVDERSSSAVRGVHAFKKARSTAVKLAKAGIEVEVATTPLMTNIELIEAGYRDFVRELQDETEGAIKFKVSLNLLPGRNVGRLSLDEKREYEQRGIRLYAISNPGGTQIPFFEEYRNGRGRIACGLGRLVFSPDGFAYVCSRIDSFPPLGNVRDVGVPFLLEVARKRLVAASVDNSIPCRECPLRHICGGGCRVDRFEKVSSSEQFLSVHKPCSEGYKAALLKMMVQATKECYTW
ncbi:MAG: radical SAM protein [Kiritimatiellia bacterium]